MKALSRLLISIFALSLSAVHTHAQEPVEFSEYDHTYVNPDGSETFFFGNDEANTDDVNFPETYIVDENGIERLHPFSNDAYPYAVIATIDEVQMLPGGQPVLRLSQFDSPFTDRLNLLDQYLQSGSYQPDMGNMIFLKADGKHVATKSSDAVFVVIKDALRYVPSIVRIATLPGEAARWQECGDRNYVGHYTGHNCYRPGRSISKHFKAFLDRNLLSCINESLERIGQGNVSRVGITHVGISGDARHRRAGGSLHNVDRAIDVKEFYFPAANKKKMNYRKGVQNRNSNEGKFYVKFRTCYQERQIRRSSSCRDNKKTNGYVATIGWEDKNHRQHMHISHPFCEGRRGYYKL